VLDKHTNLATALLGAIKERGLDALVAAEEEAGAAGGKPDWAAVVRLVQVKGGVVTRREGVGGWCGCVDDKGLGGGEDRGWGSSHHTQRNTPCHTLHDEPFLPYPPTHTPTPGDQGVTG
jgi:hypothetical protein